MANYHNAVSDKLVVVFFKYYSIFSVFSKENSLKWSSVQRVQNEYPTLLENAIFSTTHCILALCDTLLVPQHDEASSEEHFKLQFGYDAILRADILEDIKVVYTESSSFLAMKDKIVSYKCESDISLALTYFGKKKQANALYFYEADGILTLLVFKEAKLVLTNRYSVTNHDELFYFVMLAVEQLDLSVEQLYVECICTKGMHENLQVLFKNYLPKVNLTYIHWEYLTASKEATDQKDLNTLAAFFSQCVL